MSIRWGILGLGHIAHCFMEGLACVPDAKLVACASATPGKAEAFAKKYNAAKWYDSYEELAADPEIDAVYIATTNQIHLECALLALNHNKPVLCEKPLAPNEKQARLMIDTARKNDVFLMEAMWSRFFPIMKELKNHLNRIGDIKVITGDFSYSVPGHLLNSTSFRGFDPACAGGGLIDVGIYVLSFACMVLGKTPVTALGLATMSPLNIDAHSVAVFGFGNGEIVSAYSGVDAPSTSDATIYGSEGYIRVENFWHADTMTICVNDECEKIHVPYDAPGYQYEILEVHRCILQGLRESDTMPLDETLEIIKVFDNLRAQWGLVYPCDLDDPMHSFLKQ